MNARRVPGTTVATAPTPASAAVPVPTEAQVLRELFQVAPLLERFQAEGMARKGLTQPRLRLLRTLDEGGPRVMSELSRALDVTPRAVTALVDGLEGDGLVRRCEHPHDRRATVIELTATGRRTSREMREGHERLSEEILGGIAERELHASLRVVRAVRSAMEARRA
jgi:DNA-binding MarR family transcriptional regulator